MSESKFAPQRPGNGNNGDHAGDNGRASDASLDRHPRQLVSQQKRKSNNSWDTYHRWLTRVQAPGGGRIPLDPGLYTWKGYRNWSDKVRRDWKPED
ncbi:MAG: hypothetical protein JSV45_12125 [Chromatiales bacterium]|nr:MAG: hypothetical protein JSV45_12125 [Chromatiales bacterium]